MRKVLRLRNAAELLWTDLYLILEVIQGEGGPINASRREVELFTQTANSVGATGDLARHGKKHTQPPAHRMELRDGREFIDRLIRAWVMSK